MEKRKAAALRAMMDPRGIAVIGASRDEESVGYGVLKSLVKGGVFHSAGAKPFAGGVYAVNPNAHEILGKKCYARVQDIPGRVDAAVICVPAKIVPQVMRDCAQKKVKAAILISAGFAETGEAGRRLQEEVVAIARKGGMGVLGPNVLGIIRPHSSLNASFALSSPTAGKIAFVSQSGALADSIVDWALEARYGFSLLASVGNSADIDAADLLEFCINDRETKAVALYLEGLKDGRRFMEVARRAARRKPVVLLKGGRSEGGRKAVISHTASLAGDHAVYEAAMRQAGAFMAESVEDLLDLTKALSEQPRTKGRNVAIVTNGGGVGVLAADYCEQYGLNVVGLKDSTLKKLDACGKMHPAYSRANPLDIVGDALPARYEAACKILLGEKYVDGLIVVQTLQTMTRSKEDAEAVVKAHDRHPGKPVVCVFMGGLYSAPGIAELRRHNIPDYNDPLKAVKVMKVLCGVV
ncbi:MAG: CoA-binding protein [Candidatus Micrarchaeota archaeon]